MIAGGCYIRSIVINIFEGKGCMQWESNFDKFPVFGDEECTDEMVITKALKLIAKDKEWWNDSNKLIIMRVNTHDYLSNYGEYLSELKEEIDRIEGGYDMCDTINISDEEFVIYSNSIIKI